MIHAVLLPACTHKIRINLLKQYRATVFIKSRAYFLVNCCLNKVGFASVGTLSLLVAGDALPMYCFLYCGGRLKNQTLFSMEDWRMHFVSCISDIQGIASVSNIPILNIPLFPRTFHKRFTKAPIDMLEELASFYSCS